MQKKFISLMLLVAAVTSASLNPTSTMAEAEWFPIESPINYRIDSRNMRRQVPSTGRPTKEDVSASKDVLVIDEISLLKNLGSTQDSTSGIRHSSSSLALPLDTSVIGISDPLACSRICALNSECTHFTHEPTNTGGTCTLLKAPGMLRSDWSTLSLSIPKRACPPALISICIYLDMIFSITL